MLIRWSKLFKKNYYLEYWKTYAITSKDQQRRRIGITCYMYRKKKRFYIGHSKETMQPMFWIEAWMWWWLIKFMGRKSKQLFAYKFPKGIVYVQKISA